MVPATPLFHPASGAIIAPKSQPQFFLGGATWSGEDQYAEFIAKGIWRSGWNSQDDEYAPILETARVGDRIAIKKGLGQGTSKIRIRAIGIITSISHEEENWTFYVRWIMVDMNRRIPSRGCYKTIHGPYTKNDSQEVRDWLEKTFSL